jgi:hypothetical protein
MIKIDLSEIERLTTGLLEEIAHCKEQDFAFGEQTSFSVAEVEKIAIALEALPVLVGVIAALMEIAAPEDNTEFAALDAGKSALARFTIQTPQP